MPENFENPVRSGWLSEDDAMRRIEAFEKRFGPRHRLLAAHAALPLMLDPELLNLIRINFRETRDMEWIAEADILLSPLCRAIDDELFEFEPRVREVLLQRLSEEKGTARLTEIADFLAEYLTSRPGKFQRADASKAYGWIAMAYRNPADVLKKMEMFVNQGLSGGGGREIGRADRLWLVFMTEVLVDPLSQSPDRKAFEQFLEKSRRMGAQLYGLAPEEGPRVEVEGPAPGERGPAEQDVIRHGPSGYELIRIPGGTFMMGSKKSEKGRFADEGPVHEVTVESFYMGRYPVTNAEYERFLKANPKADEPGNWGERKYNRPEQPVVGVKWYDAKKFAEWAGLDLPSEAQWEYACRAGTTTRYYTGDEEKDLYRAGWYGGNSKGRLHPVGEKDANRFGLHDMHGNVGEWCEDDWHGNYDGAPEDGRAWTDEPRGPRRVVRGGAWRGSAGSCRSAYRGRNVLSFRYAYLGFRLVLLPGRLVS